MNEQQWLTATDPWLMLVFLRHASLLSDRKGRLFSCACCRGAWHLLTDARRRMVVEMAEQYADGGLGEDQLFEAWEAAPVPLSLVERAAAWAAWLPSKRSGDYLAPAEAAVNVCNEVGRWSGPGYDQGGRSKATG
jgi:hypothetical protein